MSQWRVVTANSGLVTEHELLQLLRQRGLRTPNEAARDEAAAEAAQLAAVAALEEEASGVLGDVEEGWEGAAEARRADTLDAAAQTARAAALPAPLYPRINKPFPVERAVFERLSRAPAAQQNQEKLAHFLELVSDIGLTRAELLQLINTKPKAVLELHIIIDKAEERLAVDELDDLLALCRQIL